MIYFDKGKNLLEEDKYHYQLQDVKEPELFRDLYPYTEIPKVVFNYRNVPMNMPENIWITDTTFRDGQQSTSPFTVRQIVDLFKLMARLGGPKGIVRQSEFFLYSEKDRRALEECKALGLPRSRPGSAPTRKILNWSSRRAWRKRASSSAVPTIISSRR